jgi:hypothetical protein
MVKCSTAKSIALACALAGAFVQESLTCTRHVTAIPTLVTCPQSTKLFAMLETKPQLRLVLSLEVPKSFEHLVYFVRDPAKFVTKENISQVRGGTAKLRAPSTSKNTLFS